MNEFFLNSIRVDLVCGLLDFKVCSSIAYVVNSTCKKRFHQHNKLLSDTPITSDVIK